MQSIIGNNIGRGKESCYIVIICSPAYGDWFWTHLQHCLQRPMRLVAGSSASQPSAEEAEPSAGFLVFRLNQPLGRTVSTACRSFAQLQEVASSPSECHGDKPAARRHCARPYNIPLHHACSFGEAATFDIEPSIWMFDHHICSNGVERAGHV